jgi:hypothetical protein
MRALAGNYDQLKMENLASGRQARGPAPRPTSPLTNEDLRLAEALLGLPPSDADAPAAASEQRAASMLEVQNTDSLVDICTLPLETTQGTSSWDTPLILGRGSQGGQGQYSRHAPASSSEQIQFPQTREDRFGLDRDRSDGSGSVADSEQRLSGSNYGLPGAWACCSVAVISLLQGRRKASKLICPL